MEKLKYCRIRNKGYGQRWQDFKIHYVGSRPKLLRDDGAFSSGKSLLEALAIKFRNFDLVLTPEESRIQRNVSSPQVCVALPELKKMNAGLFTQKKEVTQQAVSHLLSNLFPQHFANGDQTSPQSSVRKKPRSRKLKARFNVKALRQLARDMRKRIETDKSERVWRNYLRQNILSIQRGYMDLISKADLGLSGNSYPEFLVITHDGYFEILEIKTPFTALLSHDEEQQTLVWSPEVAGSVARVVGYLQSISDLGDQLREKIRSCRGIELPVIKLRGTIFAGNSAQFKKGSSNRDDFELLNNASRNVNVVTYDELLTRLRNHLTVLSGSKGK